MRRKKLFFRRKNSLNRRIFTSILETVAKIATVVAVHRRHSLVIFAVNRSFRRYFFPDLFVLVIGVMNGLFGVAVVGKHSYGVHW